VRSEPHPFILDSTPRPVHAFQGNSVIYNFHCLVPHPSYCMLCVLPCLVLFVFFSVSVYISPCLVLSCLVLSYLVLSCLILSLFPTRSAPTSRTLGTVSGARVLAAPGTSPASPAAEIPYRYSTVLEQHFRAAIVRQSRAPLMHRGREFVNSCRQHLNAGNLN
jgi:hypothetical protein